MSTFAAVQSKFKTADARPPSFYAEDLRVLEAGDVAMLRFWGNESVADELTTGFIARIEAVLHCRVGDLDKHDAHRMGHSSVHQLQHAFHRRFAFIRAMSDDCIAKLNVTNLRFQVLEEIRGLEPTKGIGIGLGTKIVEDPEEAKVQNRDSLKALFKMRRICAA